MSFKLVFPAAAVAVLLTGCAATPFEMRQATYDPDVSRAQNLLRVSSQGTKWDIPDTDAPEGFKGGSDGSVLLSAFGWAGNFRSAAGSGFLPGTTNWGLGLGVGLGLSLLTSAFVSDKKPEEFSHIFGYFPLKDAPTAETAAQLYLDAWAKAFIESAKQVYPGAGVQTHDETLKAWRPEMVRYTRLITFVDHSLGCYGWNETKPTEWEKRCQIYIAFTPTMARTQENALLGLTEPAYALRSYSFFLETEGKQKFDLSKIAVGAAKYMPPLSYMYLAPRENPEGKLTPPMVIEADKINFFVKPKKN